MVSPAVPKVVTAEEFYKLPDSPHGGKMELVRGEVIRHAPVGGPHGTFAAELTTGLGLFNRAHKLGNIGLEVGFRIAIGPDTVLSPDVHFVRADRLADGRSMPAAFFPGAPDLAVEIVSPDDTDREVQEKVDAYLAAGTTRVWVVRPRQESVTVHYPDRTTRTFRNGDVLGSPEAAFDVPGFERSLAELFS